MKNVKRTIWLVVAVVVMVAGQGFGTILYLNDGGTHNINSMFIDSVYVDWQSPGMQTTVNLLNGGNIAMSGLEGFNDSRLNLYGGTTYGLAAYDRSQVTISGGHASYSYIYDSSQVTISGGGVSSLYSQDSSQVTISGGDSGYVEASDNSHVTMSGGILGQWLTRGSSQVTISGGSPGFLKASDNSQVTISGVDMGDIYAGGSSQVTISGGDMGDIYAGSQVTISGGYVDFLDITGGQVTMSGGSVRIFWGEFGCISMSGGTIIGDIEVGDSVNMTIDGFDFAVDGIPVGFGEITSILGGSEFDDPFRRLTGTLANGDIINNLFQIGNDAQIMLIPEPATLLFLGLGTVMLRRKR